MVKKNNKKEKKTIQSSEFKYELSNEAKKGLIVSVAVLLFLGLFYLLTAVILGKNDSSSDNEAGEVEVQHKEILVGTSFSVKDSQYYVLYYETDDDDISTDMSSLVSNYRSKGSDTSIYTVDMSNALNSFAKSDEAKLDVSTPDELRIALPTLIKFVDGKIDSYVEGLDKIQEVLK